MFPKLNFVTSGIITVGMAGGLSTEHGLGKFDPQDKLGVLKNEYGLGKARSIGEYTAEIAKLLKAGAK